MKYTSGGFENGDSSSYKHKNSISSHGRKFRHIVNSSRRRVKRSVNKAVLNTPGALKKTIKTLVVYFIVVSLFVFVFMCCFYASGEIDGKTQSYVDGGNVMGVNGVMTYSNANANCKAYYQCLAKTTILQEITDESGNKIIIDRTDDRYKYDYFDRGEDFYIQPDLLYCMNDYIFGEHFVFPEAFTKPVAYDPDTYELLDIVDDEGNITVDSVIRNLKGEPTELTSKSVADYGLSTVCTYTSFTKEKSVSGTYILQDVYNEETGQIEQQEINEQFYIVLESRSHDILDKVVTYAGTIDYEYTQTYLLQEKFEEGSSSENESDNVEKFIYDIITIYKYTAVPINGEGDNRYLYVAYNKEGILVGDLNSFEEFVESCESDGYELLKDENDEPVYSIAKENLYKYRSQESGIHMKSVTPLNSTSKENNNEYLYDYLSVFSTYRPYIERSYETFRNMTSQAKLSSYNTYVNLSSSQTGGTVDINDPIILELGRAATEDMEESGILASFTVAQALLESGYGNGVYSELAMVYNNWFGIKAGSDWQGETVVFSTREVDSNGNSYYTDATWCVFEDRLSGLQYHSRFLWNTTNGISYRYRDCAGLTDYTDICAVLKNGGYFTEDLEIYTNAIISLVDRYDLTRFDTAVWDGKPPSYATGFGFENDTYDAVTLQATTTLNEEDREAFYEFFHATDDIYDGSVNFTYYTKGLSVSEIESLLRKTNSFINETTLTAENLTNNLWETGYLTDLSNDKRNLSYDGDMAAYIAGIAESHLGKTHETFTQEFYGYENNVAWCAIFVWCVFNQADALSCIGDNITENDPIHYLEDYEGNNIVTPTTYAKAYYEWGVKTNRLVDDYEGQCGDIAVFCWGHEQPCYDHTAIIIENLGDGYYTTIEGNDNGLCTKRTRHIDTILAIIRPIY